MRVGQLLERLNTLERENSHLRDDLSRKCGENNNLVRENQYLRENLRKEEARRQMALERLDALLSKVRNLRAAARDELAS